MWNMYQMVHSRHLWHRYLVSIFRRLRKNHFVSVRSQHVQQLNSQCVGKRKCVVFPVSPDPCSVSSRL